MNDFTINSSISEYHREHIEWIDALKGIGILLVVTAHAYGSGTFAHYVFWFHMPLFFFVSGYLYRKPNSYYLFLIRKIQHLIIPYVAFLLLLSIPEYANWYIFRRDEATFQSLLIAVIYQIYGGYFLQGWFGVFWFVTCFFLTQQTYYFLSRNRDKKNLYFGVLMGVSLTVAALNSAFFEFVKLPLGANIVAMALPIYWAGDLWSGLSERERSWTFAIGGVFALLAFAVDSFGFIKFSLDMKYNDFGLPGISFFIAISYSIVLAKVAQSISRVSPVMRILSVFGRESLGIMFLHVFIQVCIRSYLHINSAAIGVVFSLFLSLLFCNICRKSAFLSTFFLGETRNDLAKVVAGKVTKTMPFWRSRVTF